VDLWTVCVCVGMFREHVWSCLVMFREHGIMFRGLRAMFLEHGIMFRGIRAEQSNFWSCHVSGERNNVSGAQSNVSGARNNVSGGEDVSACFCRECVLFSRLHVCVCGHVSRPFSFAD
jgi:hypothetical protein